MRIPKVFTAARPSTIIYSELGYTVDRGKCLIDDRMSIRRLVAGVRSGDREGGTAGGLGACPEPPTSSHSALIPRLQHVYRAQLTELPVAVSPRHYHRALPHSPSIRNRQTNPRTVR